MDEHQSSKTIQNRGENEDVIDDEKATTKYQFFDGISDLRSL